MVVVAVLVVVVVVVVVEVVGSIGMVKYGQWWSVVVSVLGPMVVNTGFSNLPGNS